MASLNTIIEDFQSVDPRTRLDLLLDYASQLPELAEPYRVLRDQGLSMVHECQSPVFLVVQVHNDTVGIITDVPQESPTPRAFMAILVEAFDNRSTGEVLRSPDDILTQLGIARLIGMQRTRGLSAIYRHMRSEVVRRATK